MKNIVLNEREILEKALINGAVSEDYNDTVDVLIRHYLHMGYNKNEVYTLVDKFLVDNMESYRSSTQMKYLKSKINFIQKGGRFDLVNIKSIYITKSEWDVILSISNDVAARIMFVLLTTIKLYMAKNKKNTPIMIINLKDILRESSVRSTEENMFLFNELTKMGLINTRVVKSGGNKNKYHTMVRVNFIDVDNKDVKREVNNFENIVTYFYELYKGWKYRVCEECGRRFKIPNKLKAGRPQKYCSKCVNIVDNEKRKERHKNK